MEKNNINHCSVPLELIETSNSTETSRSASEDVFHYSAGPDVAAHSQGQKQNEILSSAVLNK
jgi:hypothetical protein